MAKKEILICIAFAAFVLASEIEDAEQKKRGAGKANGLNAIPTGAQKSDYTYNIYSQNPSVSNPSQAYQSPISNSFYPNQATSQYYTANSGESPPSNPSYQASPQTTSHFVPINFVPSSGYQQKYQIVQTKPSSNVQLAVLQQPNTYPTSSLLQYPHMLLSHPTNHLTPHNPVFNTPHGHFNFPHYPLSTFGNPFLTHSPMLFVPPINPNVYNNLGYTHATQGVNYYQPQAKQTSSGSSAVSSNEYEKLHTSVPQSNTPKEESDLNVQNDYISSDTNNAFKNSYNSARTYTKIV